MRLSILSCVSLVVALAASPVWAQEGAEGDSGELPPAPTDRRPRLGDDAPPEGSGGRVADDRDGALQRRRPVLGYASAEGRDITLEIGLGGLIGDVDGDAHAGELWDYDDLFDFGTFGEFRAALPLRFFSHGTTSLWAGPVIDFMAGHVNGQNTNRGTSTDVLVPDDWTMSRLVFGGLFRVEFGRWFVEGWGGFGVGHTDRLEATLDQTPSGGGLTQFVLYKRSSVGVLAGGFRFGVQWRLGNSGLTLSAWGMVGGWASGPPDAGAVGPLTGPVDPDDMHGVFAGIGMSLGISLGDFATRRAAAAEAETRRAPPGLIR